MKTEQLYQTYMRHRTICTDTRKISDSCLFFALKGENFDANEFAAQALREGAAFAIVDDPAVATDERFILVDDVLKTLQALASFHRQRLKIPVIGITGTNGKTTTKELIRSVLSQHCITSATEGNLNNHIGVPLTLLSIKEDVEIAIIEMGANHQKEIGFLCSIARPDYGLITNVGKAHLEGFGGPEGVKAGKGELYEYLAASNGTAFINTDNRMLLDMSRERNVKNVVGYGRGGGNYISADLKASSPYLIVNWKPGAFKLNEEYYIAESNLPGIYNFENILAAICIGTFFKLTPTQVNDGIRAYFPNNSRSQIVKTETNTVICDYYNANPSSMAVAIDNLNATAAETRALILGDMFELGQESPDEHRIVLEKAAHSVSGRKIFVGEEFFKLRDSVNAEFYANTSDAITGLRANPIRHSTILLKGSRGMKLEALLPLL